MAGESMSPTFKPLSGGIDNITEETASDPTPTSNELWAQVFGRDVTAYDDLPTGYTFDTDYTGHTDRVNSVHASGGDVYTGSRDGTVKNLNSYGNVEWSHSHHSGRVVSVYELNGVVYSADYFGDNQVIAADASDGSLIWSHRLHGAYVRALHASDGVVFSGGGDYQIIAADASDGSELWRHTLHNDQIKAVHASDGVVYSADRSYPEAPLYAVDASDGSQIWKTSLPKTCNSIHKSNNTLYLAVGSALAIDADDGKKLWEHNHHSGFSYSVHESNGVVYTGARDNLVVAADATDGSFLFSQNEHSDYVRSVYAENGKLYSGGDDNDVDYVDIDGIADGSTSTSFIPDGDYQLYASDGVGWYEV